jgi:hypothetical protein
MLSGRSSILRAAIAALGLAGLLIAVSPTVALGDPGKHGPPSNPGRSASHGRGAAAQPAGSANGIVQSATPKAVVVKELDGSTVSVPVAPSTRVFVDGRRASLADVAPGFVASASWGSGKPARELEAFDPSTSVAVVQSISAHAVVVTDAAGASVTVSVNPKTHVLLDGRPAPLAAVHAGDELVTGAAGPTDRPAGELRFLRPG